MLDLGCGTGMLSVAAAALGAANVTGLDIDPAALTLAAENAADMEVNVDLVCCDVTRNPCLPCEGFGKCNHGSHTPVVRGILGAYHVSFESYSISFVTIPTKINTKGRTDRHSPHILAALIYHPST